MNSISLRGVESRVKERLKQEAKLAGTSINSLILGYVHKGLGYDPTTRHERHHELDHLAGTWTEMDEKEFMDAIRCLNKVDGEMWR